jgi:hypothetical protein
VVGHGLGWAQPEKKKENFFFKNYFKKSMITRKFFIVF